MSDNKLRVQRIVLHEHSSSCSKTFCICRAHYDCSHDSREGIDELSDASL